MNPNVKKLWIEALRSGEYHQARLVLRTDDGCAYCCLGVLCDIYPGAVEWSEYEHLPEDVQKWAGANHPAVLVDIEPDDENMDSLSQANDAGYTFDQIADIIEEQL